MLRNKAILAASLVLVASGCGSGSNSTGTTDTASTGQKAVNPNAKEKSPPGDIPDSTQFVAFRLPGGGFAVRVPEGWARTGGAGHATFTSNLNSVTLESRPLRGQLTAATVKRVDVRTLAKTLNGFKLESIGTVSRSGGHAVRVRYLMTARPNAVTGRTVTDAVERYLYAHNGRVAIVTLAGPNGADNVDAWRTMSNSVRWTR